MRRKEQIKLKNQLKNKKKVPRSSFDKNSRIKNSLINTLHLEKRKTKQVVLLETRKQETDLKNISHIS